MFKTSKYCVLDQNVPRQRHSYWNEGFMEQLTQLFSVASGFCHQDWISYIQTFRKQRQKNAVDLLCKNMFYASIQLRDLCIHTF